MKWKYLVEFHKIGNPDFVAMYHYNCIDDFFEDCLYGDLHFLSHDDSYEFCVSRLDHDDRLASSFFEDFVDR